MDDQVQRINPSDLLLPPNLTPEEEQRAAREPSQIGPGDLPRSLGGSPTTSPPASACRPGSSMPAPPTECICYGAGYYTLPVAFGDPQFGTLFPCCCKLAERQERARSQQLARLARIGDQFGIFGQRTFANFRADRPCPKPVTWYNVAKADGSQRVYGPDVQRRSLETALATMRAYAAQPQGSIILVGPYGSGKTHLAAAVAHELAEREATVAYATLPDLLQFIRDGFADNSAGQRLKDLKDVDLLVFDDMGAAYETDWAAEQVYMIINARYVYSRWTIFTSDIPIEQLQGRIGSRITEFAQVVPVIAYDIRPLLAQQRQRSG